MHVMDPFARTLFPLPAAIAAHTFQRKSASHLYFLFFFFFFPPLVANQSLSGAHKNIQTNAPKFSLLTSHTKKKPKQGAENGDG